MGGKIFILGASGFLGSYLHKRFLLERKKGEVIGCSSRECNLLSMESIRISLAELDIKDIVIFASYITRLRDNSFTSMIQNITMTDNIAKYISAHPVKQLIFLSTVDIYGYVKSGVSISETLLPEPRDHYSTAKITGEYLLKDACLNSDIPLLILRLPGIYGEGDTGKSTLFQLVGSAIRNGKIMIYGDGSVVREYVYVEDVYNIINLAIAKQTSATLNVATGRSYSLTEIAEIIKSSIGQTINIEYVERKKGTAERVDKMVCDISLLKLLFPELRMTDLKEGIPLYIRLLNENLKDRKSV